MDKIKLIETVTKGSHTRKTVDPELIIGDDAIKNYVEGDILDANATEQLVKNKIDNIVDGAVEALDTLKELGDAIPTKISDLENDAHYVTKEEFEDQLKDYSVSWYGIMWTSENTVPIRVGNMELHRSLPIQNKMRRCMLEDDGTVHGYIDPTDYTKYENGQAVDYTDATYQYMVEIPEYGFESYSYVENGVTTNLLKLYPNSDNGSKSKKIYVSAVEATTNDSDSNATTKKLFSTCQAICTPTDGSISASDVTYASNAAKFRGGDGNSSNDANLKSRLGKPKTSLTRSAFRTKASARGTGWSQQYWSGYSAVVRLYVVEYCNFNSQDTYYSTTDSNGFKRGGLGAGVSTIDGSTWNNFNECNPFVPCGVTKTLVNNTGTINYVFDANEFATSSVTVSVPSYRGIENPFGHINKWTDGININTTNRITTVYTTEDISKFADDTSTNYTQRCSFTKPENGYIKTWNWDSKGDFIPTSTGGSSSSYLYDYSYWNNGWKVLCSSGDAHNGAYCGWFCFYAYYG
jgi:hypothetical protein